MVPFTKQIFKLLLNGRTIFKWFLMVAPLKNYFNIFSLFSFLLSFEDRTAPRQRRLSRKVVSGKGLKQKSEPLSKCPFFFFMFFFLFEPRTARSSKYCENFVNFFRTFHWKSHKIWFLLSNSPFFAAIWIFNFADLLQI